MKAYLEPDEVTLIEENQGHYDQRVGSCNFSKTTSYGGGPSISDNEADGDPANHRE